MTFSVANVGSHPIWGASQPWLLLARTGPQRVPVVAVVDALSCLRSYLASTLRYRPATTALHTAPPQHFAVALLHGGAGSLTCAARMVQYYSFAMDVGRPRLASFLGLLSPFFFFFFSSCLLFRFVLSTCGSLFFFFFFFLDS